MTKDKALKLALEALQYVYEGANNQGPHTGISWRCASNKVEPVIAAIDEALAEQPAKQQEPVAWMYQCSADSSGPVLMQHKKDWAESGSGLWTETPLYTSPQPSKPWVGLTDEDKQIAFDDTQEGGGFWEFADAIEAKLKEKNT